MRRKTLLVGLLLSLAAVGSLPAAADKIRNPTAVFAGLDKITGRIITFDVAIGETVQFGSLQVTPSACYTRPPTEAPQTTTFVEVEEATADKQYKHVFGGWMFASSPGLHALEHPIYDVWLLDCKGGDPEKDLIKSPPSAVDVTATAPAPAAPTDPIEPVPPPPKPGTLPRPHRQVAPAQAAPGTISGAPQPGGASSSITSLPLPPPVPTTPPDLDQ